MENKKNRLYFVSKSNEKADELAAFFSKHNISISHLDYSIEELQSNDVKRIVKDKAIKAFKHFSRDLIVEHTSLEIPYLGALPGGLTQLFVEKLGVEKIATITGGKIAKARTSIGVIYRNKYFYFEGVVRGRIASKPCGKGGFAWDPIFVPDGESRTFAQMHSEKPGISMRSKAAAKVVDFLIRERAKEGSK